MSPPYTVGWVHNLEQAPATSDAGSVIGLAAAFSTIAVLFTVFRLSVRWKTLGFLGLDDAAIAASSVRCLRDVGEQKTMGLMKRTASGHRL